MVNVELRVSSMDEESLQSVSATREQPLDIRRCSSSRMTSFVLKARKKSEQKREYAVRDFYRLFVHVQCRIFLTNTLARKPHGVNLGRDSEWPCFVVNPHVLLFELHTVTSVVSHSHLLSLWRFEVFANIISSEFLCGTED